MAGGLGAAGMITGILLILIGIPLLFLCLIGIIPIAIGLVFVIVGVGATATGTSVSVAGMSTAAKASDAEQAAAQAPKQYPFCNNIGLVPAVSMTAQRMIRENVNLAALAKSETERVLQSLPGPPG